MTTPEQTPEQVAEAAALAAAEAEEARLQAAGGAPTNEETPEDKLILGKFKTQEDLVKAYQELEAKQSQKPPATPAIETAPATEQEGEQAVTEAGLDFAAMTAEFAEKGELSDATYEALEKAGFPRDMTDQYIAGQQAVAAQLVARVHDIAGGEDAYNAAVEWAGENWGQEQKDAFNASMQGANSVVQAAMIRTLMADFSEANPGDFKPTTPSGKKEAGKGPSSLANVTAKTLEEAMRDVRYAPGPRQDVHYVAAVEQMAASGALQ